MPKEKKVVGSQIVFKEKLDGYRNQVKFKTWIVAKAFLHGSGKDFTKIFLCVTKFTTLYTFLALIAFLDFKIHQVDVIAAYLQEELDMEIYIEIPEGVKKLDSEGHY